MSFRGNYRMMNMPAPVLWRGAVLLLAGYFLCAWAGSYLSAQGGTYVSFWLPAGLLAGMLLLYPTKDWPVLCLSVLPANIAFDYIHDPHPRLAIILLFYLANVVQSAGGAWLVRRFVVERPRLATVGEFAGLVGFAGVLGTTLGAVIGAGTLVEFGLSQSFFESWRVWWGSCTMAVLVLTPMILVFSDRTAGAAGQPFNIGKGVEALLVFGGIIGLTWYFLVSGGGVKSPKSPVLALMLWAALRFGLRGGSLAVFVLAVWSAFLTTHYLTGLSKGEIESGQYVFTLQLFIAVAALVGLVPAIVLGERDQTVTKLRESEERFRTLTEAAFEGIFISENGVIVDASDQGLKMFGYGRSEMTGMRMLDLVAPASRETMARALEVESENIYGHELRRKDGSTFFAEARPKIVRIGGRKLRMTALRDITERKQAEQALRESEEKFSKAFRASPDGMSITDRETGKFVEVNDGYCRLYGYSRDEMLGHTAMELGVWDDPKDRESILQTLKTKGAIMGEEVRTRTRTGELKFVHLSAETIELEGRSCIVSVLHDVTDRIRAEDANRLQREVLEMIASGKPMKETLSALLRMIEAQSGDMLCSILLLDGDGLHVKHGAAPSLPAAYIRAIDGQSIGPSAGSCGTAAFRREPVFVPDIANDPLWTRYRDVALAHGLRACWSTPIFDAQKKVLGTFAIYHGTPRLPSERHQQLISMVTHTAAICISRHETEAEREQAVAREQKARIEYTLQLIASQEAERKRIAAELHDSMGQNLLLIKNLAEMTMRSKAPEQAYEQLGAINHLAVQCIAEARQISRDLRPLQLDHLGLKRALEAMLDHAAQASEVQFTYKLEPVDDLFSGEPALNLYRVVQESLNNILKHAHARQVNVRIERDIHEVQLRIEDDGSGFVAGKTGEKKGLGLRNITERVRMLGGKLVIDSAPGKGTLIEVTIPVAENPG